MPRGTAGRLRSNCLQQPLKQALLVGGARHLVTAFGTDRFLDLSVQKMRQLPWIAHQNDPAPSQRHRNKQIQRVRASRLVYNHTTEAQTRDGVLAASNPLLTG